MNQLPSNLIHGEIVIFIVLVYSVLAANPLASAQPGDLNLLHISLYACT